MTCQEYDGQIDDYVDGALPEPVRLECEAHLSTCASCRALTTDLQTIRQATRALEPHVPSPQVWYRLAAAIDAQPRGLSSVWLGSWQRAVAGATTCAVLIAGLSWLGGRLAPIAREHDRVASVALTTGDTLPIDAAEFSAIEQQYTAAIAGLEDITRDQRAALDMETADVLTANLKVIDGAIGESRAALDQDPDSSVAQDTLFDALRDKLALLQDTVAIISAMRQTNAGGTAQVDTGSNQ